MARGFIITALVVQGLVLCALNLPIGFDHPSSLGLDFDDFLGFLAIYLIALIAGLLLAVRQRQGTRALWAVSQVIVLPLVVCFVVLIGRIVLHYSMLLLG